MIMMMMHCLALVSNGKILHALCKYSCLATTLLATNSRDYTSQCGAVAGECFK